MKHRIVILSAFLSPFRSGAEACAEEVPLHLAAEFDFTIVTARLRRNLPARDMLHGTIPVVRVGLGFGFDKYLFPFLAPLAVRKLRPQIIHAVLESYAGLALVSCRFLAPQARRMLTCQSTNTSFLLGPMHRAAHIVTCISSVLIERAKKFGRTDATLIPNGIPYEAIRIVCASYPKVPCRILFVGRLEQMKGVDTLIDALVFVPDATLHIVGDGSLRRALEDRVRSKGVGDRVRFLGRLSGDHLFVEYAQAEIFCGLSRSEALGNVFLEAQAAGCAVLATNVGGIPDSVEDGVTGLLIAPDDVSVAAESLQRLVEDVALRQALKKQAIPHAASYEWSLIAKRYSALYTSTL